MPPRDLYEVLDIERGASDEEIKRAYRRMAVKYHPDKNQGDSQAEDAFKEVGEAYRVLADENLRARYPSACESLIAAGLCAHVRAAGEMGQRPKCSCIFPK